MELDTLLANLLFYVFSKDFQILFHNNPLILY